MKKRSNVAYPVEFRRQAVEQLQAGVGIGELARRLGVHRTVLYRWKKDPVHPHRGRNLRPAEGLPAARSLEEELQRVKEALAEKVLELDFLKGALQTVAARRQRRASSGETTSTAKLEK